MQYSKRIGKPFTDQKTQTEVIMLYSIMIFLSILIEFIMITSLSSLIKKAPPPEFLPQKRCLNAPSGARTLDTLIKSQVLYQLS